MKSSRWDKIRVHRFESIPHLSYLVNQSCCIAAQSGEAKKAEFLEAARRSVRNMKEAVRCFEDIDSEIKDVGFD